MTTLSKRAFSAGELAPSFHGRVDLEKYQSGVATLRNFQVRKSGGIVNRMGTEFIAEVKDSSTSKRLLKFVFNNDQTYALEFGNQYMRVVKNGVLQEVSGVAAWATSTAYVAGDVRSNGGVNYYCYADHTSSGSDEPGVGGSWTTYWHALTNDIYEIPTPYLTAELATLKYVQSGNQVRIVHPNHAPRRLTRTGDTTWVLTEETFTPDQAAPTGGAISGTGGSETHRYKVTAVADETYEESEALLISQESLTAPSANDHTITWTAATGALEYNVYFEDDQGIFGYIGKAGTNQFVNSGVTPDPLQNPPTTRNPFDGADDYPSVVGILQQRAAYGNTNNKPDTNYLTRVGRYNNMSISRPLQDDDSITFEIASPKQHEIKHYMDMDGSLVFTAGDVWVLNGNSAGVLTPAEQNPERVAFNGSSDVRPLEIEGSAVYLQERGNQVRDLFLSPLTSRRSFKSDDLSLFASHLFQGYEIEDWDYQQIPDSVLWCCRDDGKLLSMTYVRAQEIVGWAHHDSGAQGEFENVVVLPESTPDKEDYAYFIVKRFINGQTKRFIERMQTRHAGHGDFDIECESQFMDSFVEYNGTNTGSTTMTLSGGTDWLYTETLTLTASASYFSSGDVGKAIYMDNVTAWATATAYVANDIRSNDGVNYKCLAAHTSAADDEPGIGLEWEDNWEVTTDKDKVTCEITAYTSATVVSVKPNKTVPASLRSTAVTTWGMALNTITGLSHLEGERVNIIADGNVQPQKNVASGQVTLTGHFVKVTVGIPIIADVELLDIDQVNGETLKDKKHNITGVTVQVENTRGLFAGNDADHLTEAKQRENEDMGDPIQPFTGKLFIPIDSAWNSNGRVFIRQTDPLPVAILSIFPEGYITAR